MRFDDQTNFDQTQQILNDLLLQNDLDFISKLRFQVDQCHYVQFRQTINKFKNPFMNQNQVAYKIQCYSTGAMGHLIPMAKVIEILQKRFFNWEIKLITNDYAKQYLQKQFGSLNIVGLYPQLTKEMYKEKVEKDPRLKGAHHFNEFKQYLSQKKEFPNLIIADIFAPMPMKFAKKNGIPLIVNFPNSYNVVDYYLNVLSFNRSLNIEGFIINYSLPMKGPPLFFDKILDAFRDHGRIIFHSFVGLDDPHVMPPNHTQIGLLPSRSTSELTPEISKWIEEWKSKGKDKFIYVSFGSALKLSQRFAEKLAKIFIKLGYPVIWSLRSPFAELISDPLIFHSPWLPQESILRLPQVRAYVSHCGWGSLTEAITTETPLLCIPAFSDQPYNAQLAVKRKIGIQVHKTQNITNPGDYDIEIQQERVVAGLTELLQKNDYYLSIKRLNDINKLNNSAQKICQVVEEGLKFGHAHLINPAYEAASVRTGASLSKILKEDFLPPPGLF